MATGGRSSLSNMSEETFDFICTSCDRDNKTVEAVRYCVECLGYCCQLCIDVHKKFPVMRNHNLMGVGQGNQAANQQASLPEFPTERCSQHHDKVSDMYCEKHDVVGCITCILTNHRSCPDGQIYSIPDMVDTLFSLTNRNQVQRFLKNMMVSMDSFYDSKDTQLATLIEAKNEALRKLTQFQEALETAIKNAAEITKKDLEDMYKKMEEDILQDKTEVKKIEADLRNTRGKLEKATGNRAHQFVLMKQAEAQIKEASDQMSERKMNMLREDQLSFIPSQPLMDYIKGTRGIGEVVAPTKKKTDKTLMKCEARGSGAMVSYPRMRTGLYKVKGSTNIDITLPDDCYKCSIFGSCLTPNNKQLLLTDYNNKKLKRFDVKSMTVIDHCKLDGRPRGVCCVGAREAVVACDYPHMIQFVSIKKKIKPKRRIPMSHVCYGIATKDDKLYISNNGSSLYIYDFSGNLLKAIAEDNDGNQLFSASRQIAFNERGHMYVSSWLSNSIVCFDAAGNYLTTYKDKDLIAADGLCVDGKESIFVVGCWSENVLQFNEDGKKIGVVIKEVEDETFQYPSSVCFHQNLNRLFVTLEQSYVLKMYELELSESLVIIVKK